uniref:CSD domain-containing protein n=1 Tax=viral metagenome TaxID=1070528 RepID=A0A6C0F9L7_9ZZZZ
MSNNENNFGNEIGRVLWFDQKKGFGFIQLITPSSDNINSEVFFHYSAINSVNTFKKVYPGEYVSFTLVDSGDRSKCDNITGLYGNPLLIDNDTYIIKVIKKKRVTGGDQEEGGQEEGDGDGGDGGDEEDVLN